MSYPFEPRLLGSHRDGFTPELAPDATEINVVRRIRREVAERLTRLRPRVSWGCCWSTG